MEQNNKVKVYTSSLSGNLEISVSGMKQTIEATNNRAKYFSEQSLKYRDEAKKYAEDARYYAEQNSDVSLNDLFNLKSELQKEISTKQNIGEYALKEELPINVSEFFNDAKYIDETQFLNAVPSQDNCEGKVLYTDGEKTSWRGFNTFQLFDTKLSDKVLSYEDSKGWALQGTYVYKEAIAGSRYGYPDFYNKVVEEFNEATETETVNSVEVKVHSNGHKFYNIANKDAIDSFFDTMGSAWFYGVDIENERVFLPRNNYFEQASSIDVGQSIQAGLPNISGALTNKIIAGHAEANLATGPFSIVGQGLAKIAGGNGFQATDVYFDASRSNSIYGKSSTVQPNAVKKLLYICVGNTTNYESMTEVVNQGMEILEQVNQVIEDVSNTRVKLDGSNAQFAHITETYVNGTSGYRIWSDGFKEQWGRIGVDKSQATGTVTFLKAFSNANYNLSWSVFTNLTRVGEENWKCTAHTATTCTFMNNSAAYATYVWRACGY